MPGAVRNRQIEGSSWRIVVDLAAGACRSAGSRRSRPTFAAGRASLVCLGRSLGVAHDDLMVEGTQKARNKGLTFAHSSYLSAGPCALGVLTRHRQSFCGCGGLAQRLPVMELL